MDVKPEGRELAEIAVLAPFRPGIARAQISQVVVETLTGGKRRENGRHGVA
jgi:hypothetical protein